MTWFLIVKVQQNWSLCSARIMRFSVFSTYASLQVRPSLSYHNGDSLYCCSLAGAWTGIDLWVYSVCWTWLGFSLTVYWNALSRVSNYCTNFGSHYKRDHKWIRPYKQHRVLWYWQHLNKAEACVLLGLWDFLSSQRILNKVSRRYHIKMATHFTAALWLELELA